MPAFGFSRGTTSLALCAAGTLISAAAQVPDQAQMKKWSKANLIHYEVVGEITLEGFQVPADDADLYANFTERVRLSFDWDKKKGVIVGNPVIVNEPTKVTKLMGLEKFEPKSKPCPQGKLNGPFEYFDVVEVRQKGPGKALELVGKRIHPETQVSEACSAKLRTFKGGTRDVKEFIGPPDPLALAYIPPNMKTMKLSADGQSIIVTALNNKWVWTYTPTPK